MKSDGLRVRDVRFIQFCSTPQQQQQTLSCMFRNDTCYMFLSQTSIQNKRRQSYLLTMDRIFKAMYLSFFPSIMIIVHCGSILSHVNGFVLLRGDYTERYLVQRRHQKLHMIQDNDAIRESCIPLTNTVSTRSRFLYNVVAVGIGAVSINQLNDPVYAIEQPKPEDTIWMTGKMPKIPGQKPKDKSDVAGTRKDPNFLRSLSDCKNQCENMTGASSNSGYAKGKEECLSECQDICCTTYQQCTFPIVQRI